MIKNLEYYAQGKRGRVITKDNEVFNGCLSDYVSADDNYLGEDSIIIDDVEGYDEPVEFANSDIKEIMFL